MATIEAMASGCPALVAGAAGSTQLFAGAPGVLPLDRGVEVWAAAMRDLTADPDRRSAMRLAALAFADSRLASWREVLNEDLLPGWRAALGEFKVAGG